jgi:signal transduction histidine kinase
VVQQLAAASFLAAGQAQRAASSGGDPKLAADLDGVAAAVRDGIAGLRSLLVDIYPPSLHTAGLASALRDLAATASRAAGPAPAIDADVDTDVADSVPGQEQEAMFRIAQESVRNAVRHSQAAHIALRLEAGNGTPTLEIADDGDGFDAAILAAEGIEGHFGLRLMTEAARQGGGWLGVLSTPGAGTLVRYEAAAG